MKAPLNQVTDPADLHAQIQQMIAAAQGAPMQQPAAAPMMGAPMPPQPQTPAAPAQSSAMPQMGGSPQNMQKAMLAKAIRGG